MSIMDKWLSVEMPDKSKWAIPVSLIAKDRAKHYAHEFGGDVEQSLAEDTIPLFTDCDYEIEYWAANNMNWRDVREFAVKIETEETANFQEGWINGEKEIISL